MTKYYNLILQFNIIIKIKYFRQKQILHGNYMLLKGYKTGNQES